MIIAVRRVNKGITDGYLAIRLKGRCVNGTEERIVVVVYRAPAVLGHDGTAVVNQVVLDNVAGGRTAAHCAGIALVHNTGRRYKCIVVNLHVAQTAVAPASTDNAIAAVAVHKDVVVYFPGTEQIRIALRTNWQADNPARAIAVPDYVTTETVVVIAEALRAGGRITRTVSRGAIGCYYRLTMMRG